MLIHAWNQGQILFTRSHLLALIVIAVSVRGGEIQAQPALPAELSRSLPDAVPAPITDIHSYRADINLQEKVEPPTSTIDFIRSQQAEIDNIGEEGQPAPSYSMYLRTNAFRRDRGGSPLADFLAESTDGRREAETRFSYKPLDSSWADRRSDGQHSAAAPTNDRLPRDIKTHRDEEMNFTYTPPDSWEIINSNKFNSQTQLLLQHMASPPMSCTVEARALGPLLGLSPEQIVEVLKVGFSARGVRLEIVGVEDRTVHGILGQLIIAKSDVGSLKNAHIYWIGTHGGMTYMVSLWSQRSDGDKLLAAAGSLLDGFRIIDPNRNVPSPFATAEFSYESPESGFSLQMGKTGWREDDAFRQLGVAAEIGITHTTLTGMLVSVIPLRGETPPLPAAVRGMLTLYGLIDIHQRIHNQQAIRKDGAEGVQFDFERMTTEIGLRCYRVQIFVTNNHAYIVCASSQEKMFDDTIVDAALAGFRLDRPAKAFDPTVLPIRERANHARFFTGLGLHEFERRNFGGARAYFRVASQIEPQNPVHVENLVDAFVQEERYREALNAIDEHLDRFWDKGRLPAIHAALQIAVGNNDQAIAEFRQLLADGYWNEGDVVAFIEMVWERDGADAALHELASLQPGERQNSPQLTSLRGDLLVDAGRHEEAIALLRSGRERDESNALLAVSLIAAYREASREREAMSLAEEIVAGPHAAAGIWFQKGLTELKLERYPDAKTSFETANRLLPGVPQIEQLLALTTSVLGQGDTQVVSTPIEPVALPDGVELSALSVDDPRRDDASAYNAWRIRAIEFHQDQEFRKTYYQSFAIRDESAVEALRTLQYTFNPLYEELYLNRLDVFDAEGNKVASADRHDAYVTHQQMGDQATDELTLHVPVPGLRPGHRVEVVVTTRDLTPPEEFPYEAHMFASGYPAGYDVVLVRGDVDRVTWVGRDPVHKTENELVWLQRHVPAVPYEEDQEAPIRFVPCLELADARSRWAREVEEYLDTVKDRLPTPPETQTLARQITASTDESKVIVALAEYVQAEFTYQALEFGRHTRVMEPSDVVIANKYGDCKDLSLLLWQMLKEHGVAAHLALVHSSGELTPDLETIDQCDHMVVYLPDPAGGRVLDPTDRWGNPRLPVPRSLGGSHAVILDAADPRIERLPPCPEDQFHRSVAASVRLAEDRSAEIEQSLQFEGYAATSLRSLLGYYSPKEREDVVRQYVVVSDPGVQIRTIDIDNLNELERPLVIRLTGTVQDALHDADGRFVGHIPLLSRVHELSVEDEPERRTPFAFKNPLTTNTTIDIIPPEGWTVQTRADHPSSGENEFVLWSLRQRTANGRVVLESAHRRHAGRFPASRRSHFREAVNTAAAAISPRIALHPGNLLRDRTANSAQSAIQPQ